jgi:hypothetical protein
MARGGNKVLPNTWYLSTVKRGPVSLARVEAEALVRGAERRGCRQRRRGQNCGWIDGHFDAIGGNGIAMPVDHHLGHGPGEGVQGDNAVLDLLGGGDNVHVGVALLNISKFQGGRRMEDLVNADV